jgi:hypothetical protein
MKKNETDRTCSMHGEKINANKILKAFYIKYCRILNKVS